MADNYTIVSAEDQPQVLSATQVIPATTIGFITHPSEVYCESTLPKLQVARIGANTVVEPLAFNIERLLADGIAAAATFVQAVDSSGLLTGAMDFTVALPSTDVFAGGELTVTVRLTIRQLYLLSDNLILFTEARTKLEGLAGL